jgi:hypothetical protein
LYELLFKSFCKYRFLLLILKWKSWITSPFTLDIRYTFLLRLHILVFKIFPTYALEFLQVHQPLWRASVVLIRITTGLTLRKGNTNLSPKGWKNRVPHIFGLFNNLKYLLEIFKYYLTVKNKSM